jgi:hypothetical protein
MKTKLKRTRWTNEEVIKILEGLKIVDADGKDTDKVCVHHNIAIDMAKDTFVDFSRRESDYGAKAYDPVTEQVYYIGKRLPR